MELIIDFLHLRIDCHSAGSDDMIPRNRACIVCSIVLRCADFNAEHDVPYASIPIVHGLLKASYADKEVVEFRPLSSRENLLDIIVKRPLLIFF